MDYRRRGRGGAQGEERDRGAQQHGRDVKRLAVAVVGCGGVGVLMPLAPGVGCLWLVALRRLW